MFGEIPDHIRKRHEKDVPSLGSLDGIVLPAAPVRYELIPPEAETRAAVLDGSALLDKITDTALTRLKEKLEDGWAGDPKEDAIMMDAVRLTLTTQLRVDDSRLKKRTNDTLAALLELHGDGRSSVDEGRGLGAGPDEGGCRARIDRVTETPQETHSVGYPMSQQTNSGFNAPGFSVCSDDPFEKPAPLSDILLQPDSVGKVGLRLPMLAASPSWRFQLPIAGMTTIPALSCPAGVLLISTPW